VLLGVDVGGTFTDAVLVGPDSRIHTAKVPSTPSEESRAVLGAVGILLADAGVRPGEIERFAHGMTVATNALLEGRGARTALIATAGFTDLLDLARQARPHLYRPCLAGPRAPIAPELRFAAPERTGPDGPEQALEPDRARELIELIARSGPQAVAVCLLHSYAHPEHELLLGELLSELLPEAHVSLSHDLVGTFREYERTATTAVDASLSPLLGGYLERLSTDARASGLPEPQIMQSSGGLTDSARAGAHAALTVLSGPAGGVGGALLLADLAGHPDVLCFDMGGTSCDVCLIEGSRVSETAERTIGGRPLALPALDIHTVGAGGGSIAWRDPGGALRVGPASAGALPGPACYGRGGTEPTVTDANLLLGRLPADRPLAGGLTLDRRAAERAVGALAGELQLDSLACARGIVRVAEGEMLRALRVMTIERGIDPRRLSLMPFGGAGPLHAAALAEALGIGHILCPRTSGVLSALGLAAAAPRRDASRTVMLAGPSLTAERLESELDALIDRAGRALGAPAVRIRVRHELRYRGQSFELAVESEGESAGGATDGTDRAGLDRGALDPESLCEAFARAHEERYGYREDDGEVELVTIRVSLFGPAPAPDRIAKAAGAGPEAADGAGGRRQGPVTRPVAFEGAPLQTPVLSDEPAPGQRLSGPAVWALGQATLLVPPGWSGEVDPHGTIHLTDTRAERPADGGA
jgi:N-methylhydantoinase A